MTESWTGLLFPCLRLSSLFPSHYHALTIEFGFSHFSLLHELSSRPESARLRTAWLHSHFPSRMFLLPFSFSHSQADCDQKKGWRAFFLFLFPFLFLSFSLWGLVTAVSRLDDMSACGFVDESKNFDSERAKCVCRVAVVNGIASRLLASSN